MSTKTTVGILVALIAVMVVFYFVTSAGAPPPPPKPPPPPTKMDTYNKAIQLACKPQRGSATAPWTVVELGDFQCPICGRSRQYIERLIDSSNGQAKMYFINYPLEQHMFAQPAAIAAIAASHEGKFWAMYDQLYSHQDQLNPNGLITCAKAAGLDMKKFKADDRSSGAQQMLSAQRGIADMIGVMATPTFLVHKDGTSDVSMYVGLWPNKQEGNVPGLRQLMLNCPWGAKFTDAQLPPLKSGGPE